MKADFSIKRSYASFICRRPIKMSLLCQLQMTLPWGFPRGFGVTVRLMSDGELLRLGCEPGRGAAPITAFRKVAQVQGTAGQYPICRFDEAAADVARSTVIDATAP
jgi:hypothetical protein